MNASTRRIVLGAVALALVCPLGRTASPSSQEDAETRRLREQIAKTKIAKIEFADTELGDAISFLRDVAKLNIHVKWYALKVAGIEKTTAVNVHLKDVTVARALAEILDDLGSGGASLDYEIRGNVLTISTREDLSRRTELRIYDVQDLIEPSEDHGYSSEIRPPTWEKKRPSGRVLYDEDLRGRVEVDPDPFERRSREGRIMDLITLIRETVDPTSWRAAGSEVGAVREIDGRFIITQTLPNHQAVEELLDALRETILRGPLVSVTARWVEVDSDKAPKLLEAGPKEATPLVLKACEAKTKYTGKVSGLNGQAFHIASGRVMSFVTNLEPVVAENAAAYRPRVEKLLLGAALEVRPVLCQGREEAVLTIRSVVSGPNGPASRPASLRIRIDAKGSQPPVPTLDRLDLLVHTLRTTLRVPLGKAVLVGAMTAPKAKDHKVLCLIVEVSASQFRKQQDKDASRAARTVRAKQ